MRFKTFLQIEQSSELGLMVNKPVKNRKPSDGHAFANKLNAFSGGEGNTAGPSSGAAFMKKSMKKRMKKS